MQNLAINGERLWGELMETAAIGGTSKGGICRLTLTDLDRQVRDWFKAKAEALGCHAEYVEEPAQIREVAIDPAAEAMLQGRLDPAREARAGEGHAESRVQVVPRPGFDPDAVTQDGRQQD